LQVRSSFRAEAIIAFNFGSKTVLSHKQIYIFHAKDRVINVVYVAPDPHFHGRLRHPDHGSRLLKPAVFPLPAHENRRRARHFRAAHPDSAVLAAVRPGKVPTPREIILFLVFAALWVEGQGMHLSANSIKHLMDDLHGTDVYTLTNFYDEVLSHYLWHLGMVALIALIIWRQVRNPLASPLTSLRTEVICAVIYGIVTFIIVIEAGTVPLGLPFAAAVTVVGLTQRSRLREQPITAYFFLAHALALILFVIWFLRWGGFPQFSELGLI
jgi:hypothetical protein